MKRLPLAHEKVFNDGPCAQRYAERHRKMAEGFGREQFIRTRQRPCRSLDSDVCMNLTWRLENDRYSGEWQGRHG